MAELSAFLLVALSGRALAMAAHRAGRRAIVLDLFGDSDMRSHAVASRVIAGNLATGFDAKALLSAAEELAPAHAAPPFGLVYGSGLEDRPDLLAALSQGRQLFGNSPETVRFTKDPKAFFPLLERLSIPHPPVSYSVPQDPERWLVKRVGASGGGHVLPALAVDRNGRDRYFQRRVDGRPVGVSFLADGRRARLIGFSEQWRWSAGGESFLFGGAFQPAPIDAGLTAALPALLDRIVSELGLVGLNSLDMIVDGCDFHVIEVNPRPGANLDLFEGVGPAALFELHLRACSGDLPDRIAPMSHATAMAVVYAKETSIAPLTGGWPDWVADRPAPGARIEKGAPVCTVLATAATAAEVRQLVDRRVASVLARLRPDAPLCPAEDVAAGA